MKDLNQRGQNENQHNKHYCARCHTTRSADHFLNPKSPGSRHKSCTNCRLMEKARIKRRKQRALVENQCSHCRKIFRPDAFLSENTPEKRLKRCAQCRSKDRENLVVAENQCSQCRKTFTPDVFLDHRKKRLKMCLRCRKSRQKSSSRRNWALLFRCPLPHCVSHADASVYEKGFITHMKGHGPDIYASWQAQGGLDSITALKVDYGGTSSSEGGKISKGLDQDQLAQTAQRNMDGILGHVDDDEDNEIIKEYTTSSSLVSPLHS